MECTYLYLFYVLHWLACSSLHFSLDTRQPQTDECQAGHHLAGHLQKARQGSNPKSDHALKDSEPRHEYRQRWDVFVLLISPQGVQV